MGIESKKLAILTRTITCSAGAALPASMPPPIAGAPSRKCGRAKKKKAICQFERWGPTTGGLRESNRPGPWGSRGSAVVDYVDVLARLGVLRAARSRNRCARRRCSNFFFSPSSCFSLWRILRMLLPEGKGGICLCGKDAAGGLDDERNRGKEERRPKFPEGSG